MTMRLLILGAGGQGQVLADALLFAAEAGQPLTPVGYLDDNCHLPDFGESCSAVVFLLASAPRAAQIECAS